MHGAAAGQRITLQRICWRSAAASGSGDIGQAVRGRILGLVGALRVGIHQHHALHPVQVARQLGVEGLCDGIGQGLAAWLAGLRGESAWGQTDVRQIDHHHVFGALSDDLRLYQVGQLDRRRGHGGCGLCRRGGHAHSGQVHEHIVGAGQHQHQLFAVEAAAGLGKVVGDLCGHRHR